MKPKRESKKDLREKWQQCLIAQESAEIQVRKNRGNGAAYEKAKDYLAKVIKEMNRVGGLIK